MDPKFILIELAKIAHRFANADIPKEVMNLRTRELRPFLERRQAVLFCYGLAQCVVHSPIAVAAMEDADFDCIARWTNGDEPVFTPIQLKELPPAEVAPRCELQDEINKLTKYTSPELVVAFHLNRREFIDFSKLEYPTTLKFSELWFFGSRSPVGQGQWILHGNALGPNCGSYSFEYPKA